MIKEYVIKTNSDNEIMAVETSYKNDIHEVFVPSIYYESIAHINTDKIKIGIKIVIGEDLYDINKEFIFDLIDDNISKNDMIDAFKDNLDMWKKSDIVFIFGFIKKEFGVDLFEVFVDELI